MNGQIQKSLQILQLSSCDLTAMLREEVNDNPLLELEGIQDYSTQRTSRVSKLLRHSGALFMQEQRQFLHGGFEAMVPLTMKELADKLDMHESTVSRAVHNKYISTPHGTFVLKFFFSSGLQRQDGEVDSSIKIKARVKELIQNEDKSRPHSDQKIAEILAAERLRLSRRTVTKYREELNILPTFLRKSRS